MRRVLAAVIGAVLALLGCRSHKAEPKAPDLTVLSFPVLVIHDSTSITVHRSPEGLMEMGVQRVIARENDPLLVDARFQVFALAGLRSTKSGLGLWVSGGGTGYTPVTFTLEPRPDLSGLERAHALILKTTYLAIGPDENERAHRDVARQRTMAGIVAVLTPE